MSVDRCGAAVSARASVATSFGHRLPGSVGGTPSDFSACSATSRNTGAAISPPYTSPRGSSMKTPITMRGASAGANPTNELKRLSAE